MSQTPNSNQPIPSPTLPTYQDLNTTYQLTPELQQEMVRRFQSPQWIDTFNCICVLRSINKFNPQMSSNVIQHFLSYLGAQLHHGVPLIIKNSLMLMREVFLLGNYIDVRTSVVFVPYLLKKSVFATGQVKEMALDALNIFSNNCGYDESFQTIAQNCFDKVPEISELALKVFSKLIGIAGDKIIQLQPQTMRMVAVTLHSLQTTNRPSMKTLNHEITMYIFNILGVENFVKLLNFTLGNQKAQEMMTQMEKRHASLQENQTAKEMRQSKINRTVSFKENQNVNQGFFSNGNGLI